MRVKPITRCRERAGVGVNARERSPQGPSDACERREVAGDACPATIAHDAPLLTVGVRPGMPVAGSPVELAPVDDHGDVRLVLVVLDELRKKLIGERPWYDAIDHLGPDLTPRVPIGKWTKV
jgi:hypothetical protein